MEKQQITVFGLQRSGTNYTEQLIKENFTGVQVCNIDASYIWKHGYNFPYERIRRKAAHVYISKDPYVWIESILRKNVDILRRYPEVIARMPCQFQVGQFSLQHLAQLYTKHIKWWHAEETKSATDPLYLRYEDLVSGPEPTKKFLDTLQTKFNLKRVSDQVIIPVRISQSEKWNSKKTEWYSTLSLDRLSWLEICGTNIYLPDEVFELTGRTKLTTNEQWAARYRPVAKYANL